MHRRTFVRALGATLAAPASLRALSAAGPAAGQVRRIGIQLYSLRDAARLDLDRTLASIASMGYGDVEMLQSMGNFGHPAAHVRQMLDKHRLRAPSTHVGTEVFTSLARHLDDARTLGHQYLVLASLPEERRRTADDYRYWADQLNRAGAEARKAGVWIGFHDEAWDFAPLAGGGVGYDALVERLDPSLVRLQLDTGNMAIGGGDPLAYAKRYRDRYWSFHIKDAPAGPGAKHDVELGKGTIDFKRLFAGFDRLDERLVFVEQESYPGAPEESMRRDYAYLKALRF